jgi:hypothetical protein
MIRMIRRASSDGRHLFGRLRRFAGRVRRGVPRRGRALIERLRARLPEGSTDGIPNGLLRTKRAELAGRRTFGGHDLARLERMVGLADEVVLNREAWARREDWPERFVTVRHDMDHDVENAVRFAEWEAAHGIRATYYVLHGDWYWGGPEATEPSPMVLKALERIASLGHEIGLHNTAITLALKTGRDPFAILERDLGALRRAGFEVTGSVAHGDPLCHQVGYVNSELFTECTRPERYDPSRELAFELPGGRTHRLRLRQRPMADFGLDYEANWLGHTRYLSDTGGRWSRPWTELADAFEREGGYVQLLIHPVWWAFSGEVVKPRPSVVAPVSDERARGGDPSAAPFEIVVRGDCCSRRAIDMNRDLFGDNPRMIRDEKARTDFFVEHLTVGSPTVEDVRRVMDVDSMSHSLRTYALGQVERTVFEAEAPKLIVIDNYSDMNFAAWRHREHGWKLWVHPKFIRDREAFEREFVDVKRMSFEESLAEHVRLIEDLRGRYGDLPVLYLHQPVAYYRKLEPRLDFRRLGPELERAVPKVYAGDVDDAELDPDDMGSCGPGQTLHFTGPTYRKMIQVALEKGLAEWLPTPTPAAPTTPTPATPS